MTTEASSCPRLEFDLAKVETNARILVERCADRGLSVTGVTKVLRGLPALASTFTRAGVVAVGDSRVDNLERIEDARSRAGSERRPETVLIRSPMPSQVDRVVRSADVSCNTELEVLRRLSAAAARIDRRHGVIIMVELGDLREGVMVDELSAMVGATLGLGNLTLRGIGTNLACRSGVIPDGENMGRLSALAMSVEAEFGIELDIVSGETPPIWRGCSPPTTAVGSTTCDWGNRSSWASSHCSAGRSTACTSTPSLWSARSSSRSRNLPSPGASSHRRRSDPLAPRRVATPPKRRAAVLGPGSRSWPWADRTPTPRD